MSAHRLLRRLGCFAIAALSVLDIAVASDGNLSDYRSCRRTKLAEFDGTIVDAAIATPELSTLKDLVVAADLAGVLSGAGPFTVFAPTNDAFGKVPAPLLGLIGGDKALLTTVLTYHVVSGYSDPRKPIFPREVKTVQGQTIFVEYDMNPQVNQSNASCQGVKTRNGIVWLIDSVLLPQFR